MKGSKVCTSCKEAKSIESFSKDRQRKVGMFFEDPLVLAKAIEYLTTEHPQVFKARTSSRAVSRRVNALDDDMRCADCGGRRSANAVRCRDCAVLHQYASRRSKIDWPPLDELETEVATTSYSQAARRLGVSDNAVRKHVAAAKRYEAALAGCL